MRVEGSSLSEAAKPSGGLSVLRRAKRPEGERRVQWSMVDVLELKSYLNLNLNLFWELLRLIASEVYGRMRPTHES